MSDQQQVVVDLELGAPAGAGDVGIALPLDEPELVGVQGPLTSVDDASVPHVAWPLRLTGGRLAIVEQDTLADVTQCVNVLLVTPRGARMLAPDFGIDDPTFTDGLDVDHVLEQAAEYEERAAVVVREVLDDGTGVSITRLEVDLA